MPRRRPPRAPPPGVVDLPRVRAALERLDQAVEEHPELTSPGAQERLGRFLEAEGRPRRRRHSERAAEMIRRGMRENGERLRDGCPIHWGIVTKHASGGRCLHSPSFGRPAPKLAAKVRRELLLYVLAGDAPPLAAIEVLEAFDLEYPRGWTFDLETPWPMVGHDREEQMAPGIEAWRHCRAAAGVTDEAELERLRGAVRAAVHGWPADVVSWYVAQVEAVAEATRPPPPGSRSRGWRRGRVCPRCRGPVAPVVYGEPARDPREDEAAGRALFVGCCVVEPRLAWACFPCCDVFGGGMARVESDEATAAREHLRQLLRARGGAAPPRTLEEGLRRLVAQRLKERFPGLDLTADQVTRLASAVVPDTETVIGVAAGSPGIALVPTAPAPGDATADGASTGRRERRVKRERGKH